MAWQKAGVLEGTMPVPGFKEGKSSAEVKWLVRLKGNSPLTVVVSSMKGGTEAKEIIIN
jgi:hypothetical protein